MYCEKCGNPVDTTAVFCENCGAPIVKENSLPAAASFERCAQQAETWLRTPAGGKTAAYLATAVLQVVMILLWYKKILSASVMGMSQSFALNDMCEGAEFVPVVTVVLLAAGAVCSLLAARKPDAVKPGVLMLPKVASAWTLTFLLFGVIGAVQSVREYSGYGATTKLELLGWIYGAVCVGTVLLLFKLAPRKKKSPQAAGYGEKTV